MWRGTRAKKLTRVPHPEEQGFPELERVGGGRGQGVGVRRDALVWALVPRNSQ